MIKLAVALVVAWSAAWSAAASAAPTVVSDDDLRWQIDVPDGWNAAPREDLEAGKSLAVFVSGKKRLVLLRLRGNTDRAMDGKATFFAGLEDGVRKESPDYRRLSGTVRKLGRGKTKKTPGYDLWYRTGDTVRGVRFIFLRNYCLMGTVEWPETKTVPRDARRMLESLEPAF